MRIVKIEWEGPLSLSKVIKEKNDWGNKPDYCGNDYGLYQIYGSHILCGKDTLLYIGKAVEQTFSQRFKGHKKDWLGNLEVRIYLGRTIKKKIYSWTDKWKAWKRDISMVEHIMIYKYTPNYNGSCIAEYPRLYPTNSKVMLLHLGNRGKIKRVDNAPGDYKDLKWPRNLRRK